MKSSPEAAASTRLEAALASLAHLLALEAGTLPAAAECVHGNKLRDDALVLLLLVGRWKADLEDARHLGWQNKPIATDVLASIGRMLTNWGSERGASRRRALVYNQDRQKKSFFTSSTHKAQAARHWIEAHLGSARGARSPVDLQTPRETSQDYPGGLADT